MIIKEKIRGFICTTAHPTGCAYNVQQQIDTVKANGSFEGPKKVLVVGASTGYGLASRITTAFGSQASTIGVSYDKASRGKRTATAGWYNTAAFEQKAHEVGLYAKSVIGDAYSNDIKNQVIDLIKEDLGEIDLLVYSLAAPKRMDPETGEVYKSVLKPIGSRFENTTIDIMKGIISDVAIDPATDEEVAGTVKVMGGEDWALWIDALKEAGVLAKGFKTTAYSYIGPNLTYDVYRLGSIGKAKEHLEKTAFTITDKLKDIDGTGYVSVCKALVTQASSAIPVVPLYITLLFKLMKEKGTHEGCIEQIERLMRTVMYTDQVPVDSEGRLRVDDLEMDPVIQDEIEKAWEDIATLDLSEVADLEGYQKDFLHLFGFGFDGIDYEADVEAIVPIPSVVEID